jgi:hypothetical protein
VLTGQRVGGPEGWELGPTGLGWGSGDCDSDLSVRVGGPLASSYVLAAFWERWIKYPRVRSGYFTTKEDDVSKHCLETRLSRLWPAQRSPRKEVRV